MPLRTPSPSPSLDAGEPARRYAAQFLASVAVPPALDDFLHQVGALTVQQLLDVLLIDQEQRWQGGNPVPVEDYLRRFPALAADTDALLTLVHGEMYCRQRGGQELPLADYQRRFPAHAAALARDAEVHCGLAEGWLGDLLEVPAGDQTMASLGVPVGMQPLAGDDEVLAALRPTRQGGDLGRLGPYRLWQRLGAGGMGIVYEAEDTVLKRRVAVKVMRPRPGADPIPGRRFLREAQLAATLRHEHVLPVYHFGEDRGIGYLVMPLLTGKSLEEQLQSASAPLATDDVVRIGREVAAGLEAAHAHGLVHRDIKPANIWLETNGRALILDFGLARGRADTKLTQTGAIVGTPGYIAPEQANGKEADARSDLFGLGCVLYRMATGRPPFEGGNVQIVLAALLVVAPPPPRELNPALPPWLERLILQLLEKEPERRPVSARAVIAALDAKDDPRPPTRRRALLSGGVAATLLLGGGTAYLMRGCRAPLAPREEAPPFAFHKGAVRGLAVLADGRTAVSAGADRTACVWDVETGQEKCRFRMHTRPLTCLAVSHDGRWALTGSQDSSVRLWEVATGREVHRLDGHDSPIVAVGIAPDGLRGFSSDASTFRVWDLKQGKEAPRVLALTPVLGIAVSRTGARAILSRNGDNSAGLVYEIWMAADAFSNTPAEHAGGVYDVGVSRDADVGFSAGSTHMRIWGFPPLHPLRALRGFRGPQRAALCANGALLFSAGVEEPLVRLWDTAQARELWRADHPGEAVGAVALTADAHLALTGHADGTVRPWRLPRSVVASGALRPPLPVNVAALKTGDVVRLQYRWGPEGARWLAADSATGKVYLANEPEDTAGTRWRVVVTAPGRLRLQCCDRPEGGGWLGTDQGQRVRVIANPPAPVVWKAESNEHGPIRLVCEGCPVPRCRLDGNPVNGEVSLADLSPWHFLWGMVTAQSSS